MREPAPAEPAGIPGRSMRPGSEEVPGARAANFKFPLGFLWGAATSSHQVEGNCTNNDWWAWEEAGKVREPSGLACDHYRRFREDFDLARELGHNAHRFSLEWSRIEPEEGRFSTEAIAHYRDVMEALRERGMEPVVTIHHFTLPRWLAEKGGWESDDIERRFERFVVRVVEEYRELARWWVTLNEPVVHVFKSYVIGQWPPGKQDLRAAVKVMRRMLRAHVRAYHAIHSRRPDAMVSVAQHALALGACNPRSWRDRLSVRVRSYLFNQLFLDALHRGALRVPGLLWERLPSGRTLDFVGINYYTRDFVRNTGFDLPGFLGNACPLDHHQHIGKRSSLGWEIYPEGLAAFLRLFARYRLPILVTENGVAADRDPDRWTFISLHLWQVARAIADGIPVLGYLYWSLLDNYEWADGYVARFGLVGVDFATQERTVRESARMLGDVIRRNEL
ncbi:MAG: glycoside hydrolase family 1 protein [Candidatus Eisenbacteria bacterium]|uniref:Glycoside hydrolase family 1 protein n=1 Tax=Eiseniibacteriota bacterium TaxID=2212470 RepID=A0A538SIB3_UNCEI|nr:MAG: glycoside hydrolase family 1 protein [Candidatus Eisenbacteria bacterium]